MSYIDISFNRDALGAIGLLAKNANDSHSPLGIIGQASALINSLNRKVKEAKTPSNNSPCFYNNLDDLNYLEDNNNIDR